MLRGLAAAAQPGAGAAAAGPAERPAVHRPRCVLGRARRGRRRRPIAGRAGRPAQPGVRIEKRSPKARNAVHTITACLLSCRAGYGNTARVRPRLLRLMLHQRPDRRLTAEQVGLTAGKAGYPCFKHSAFRRATAQAARKGRVSFARNTVDFVVSRSQPFVCSN